MELQPNLEPIAALIGTWRGRGSGEYPTLEPFEFTEELTFTNVGKPFLTYLQRTWSPDGKPMHTETGFLRVPGGESIEFVIAQPTGQTELAEGTLAKTGSGFEMGLQSSVTNSATAKRVEAIERTYRLAGDDLSGDFAMAAAGYPMTHHLSSNLTRQDQ